MRRSASCAHRSHQKPPAAPASRRADRRLTLSRQRYTWTVASNPDFDSAFEHAGIYRENGTPKPACDRFADRTGGRCEQIAALPSLQTAPPEAEVEQAGAAQVRASPTE
jgi:hypothetical protein